jgi:capsule polysaccharide modification protein KpsS
MNEAEFSQWFIVSATVNNDFQLKIINSYESSRHEESEVA